MQHYAAVHPGLNCLQKYSFRGFLNPKHKGLDVHFKYPARPGLNFGPSLHNTHTLSNASSEGSGESAHLHRLT